MSSLKIHLCIANKLKEKYDMTNDFVFGHILPDIEKLSGKSSDSTHYTVETIIDGFFRKVPDIDRYERENSTDLFNFDELKLGYLMHLIQDNIWYNNMIPRYAKTVPNRKDEVFDLIEKRTILLKNFSQKINDDYYLIDKYQMEKYGYTNNYFLQELSSCNLFENYKDIIIPKIMNDRLREPTLINYFTEKDSDNYIKLAYKYSEDALMRYIRLKK